MNLGRIFASAIVRRLAYVLVAMALAWFGFGEARAQDPNCYVLTSANAQCPYRDVAHAQARAAVEHAISGLAGYDVACHNAAYADEARYYAGYNGDCTINGVPQYVRRRTWAEECPVGQPWNEETKTCGTDCLSHAPLTNVTASPGSSEVCQDQCTFECSGLNVDLTVDGETRSYCGSPAWNPSGGQCSTTGPGAIGPPAPAPTDSDGDGSSDGNDSSPNNPGSGGQGPDGDGPADGDSDCGGPDQPVCGAAGSGSGNGNTSGGGGDCKTPPNSKGDQILAQIAFQTWATRCGMKGNANIGIGIGDGNGEGDGDGWEGEPGPFPDQEQGEDPELDDHNRQVGFNLSVIDEDGLLGGGSCPSFGTIDTSWGSVNLDANGYFCQIIAVARACLLLLGAFISMRILMGGRLF